MKKELMKDHFKKIEEADAIIVINKDKKRIRGYVGGATFSEISYAHYLNKRIFFTNPIPEGMNYTDELRSYEPIMLNNIEQLLE